MADSKTNVAVFESRSQADAAIQELKQRGFTDSQIGIVYRDASGETKTEGDGDSDTGKGALTGALAGVGIGGLVGLGVLAGVIPVIGPAIAGGTLGIILSNAAGGAAVAGVVGALTGMGLSKTDAEDYQHELEAGKTLVTVTGEDQHFNADAVLQKHGGRVKNQGRTEASSVAGGSIASRDYSSREDAATEFIPETQSETVGRTGTEAYAQRSESADTPHRAEHEEITLHEEQVDVRAREVPVGEVQVRKEIVVEHQQVDVPLTREEIVIERTPATGTATTPGAMKPEEIRIPVSEEQVDVQKRTVAKENVRVGKRQVTTTERVDTEVKKEEPKVDKKGEVKE